MPELKEPLVTPSGTASAFDQLGTYARLRCVHIVIQGGWSFLDSFNFSVAEASYLIHKPLQAMLLPLVTITLIWPSVPAVFLLHLQAIVTTLQAAPFVWEMDYWTLLMDLGVVVAIFAGLVEGRRERNALAADIASTVCPVFVILMFSAGFWKLNTTFLDYRTSCATPFLIQLVAAYIPESLTPAWLPWLLVRAGPLIGTNVECLYPALLVFPGWPRYLGLVIGSLFHLGIAWCPLPNNAGMFSLHCLAGAYALFLPASTAAAWGKLAAPCNFIPRCLRKCIWALLMVSVVAGVFWAGIGETLIPYACTAISLGCYAAIYIDFKGRSGPWLSRPTIFAKAPNAGLTARSCRWLMLILTFLFSYVFLILGLMDMSNNEVFGSLHQHGGSNHLLLPTQVLQRYFADPANAAEWPWLSENFQGGVVRIDSTDSDTINQIYPGGCTSLLPSRAAKLLADHGHVATEFQFEVARVLGPQVLPANTPGPDFVRYTIPALELRRIISEATAAKTEFSLNYTRPAKGQFIPEKWWYNTGDAPVDFVQVVYKVDGQGQASCTAGGVACAPEELVLQSPPRGWGAKFLVHTPHAIIGDGSFDPACTG